MDCTYESKAKRVVAKAEDVYARLSDFNSLSSAMPANLVKDWEATPDDCHFSIEKFGRVGLRIEDRTPHSTIKYGHDGSFPFDMNIWVQIKQLDDGDCALKVTLKADLNLMAKMVAAKPLQNLVDSMADSMSRASY